MKKIFMGFFMLMALTSLAGLPHIAVGDFKVQSNNPRLLFIGKGIAELISAHLNTNKLVVIIDREKRETILSEIEFSLSDIANSKLQVEAGKLLSADYMLFGELIDMDNSLLLSCKLIKVETGEVVWSNKNLSALSDYDDISRRTAMAILKSIGIDSNIAIADDKSKSVENIKNKEKAVIAFSSAVDAIDRNDLVEAKKQIDIAAKLDKNNPAVQAYFEKLYINTSKFRVLVEPFYFSLNPASLGTIHKNTFYTFTSIPTYPIWYNPPIDGINMIKVKEEKYLSENIWSNNNGYAFSIGSNIGMAIEVSQGGYLDSSSTLIYPGDPGSDDNFGAEENVISGSIRGVTGISLGLGYKIASSVSLGIGLSAHANSKTDAAPFAALSLNNGYIYGASFGIQLNKLDESIIFDTLIGYTTETFDELDSSTLDSTSIEKSVPLYIENTLLLAFNKRTFFFVLKQIDKIDFDSILLFSTLMPSFEYFLNPYFSFRGGIEGSLLFDDGNTLSGYGVLGGITLRSIRSGIDFDLTTTYRMRPSRVIPGLLYPDFLIIFGLSINGKEKN